MKIVFFGTPQLAASVLGALSAAGHETILVVTQTDKPRGRGKHICESAAASFAREINVPVYKPATLRSDEMIRPLLDTGAEMFVVAAYGKILPREVLDIPPLGCVCVHASLLPALRGAAPINRAIMEGHTTGGVTIMRMDEGIDTGDILLVKQAPISDEMNAGEYHDAVARLGGEAIVEYLESYESVTPMKQNDSLATYAPKIEKSELKLDFSDSSINVYNKIRGLSPSPCAFFLLDSKRIKVIQAVKRDGKGRAGEIIKADEDGIEIACGSGSIAVTILQPEGKQSMSSADFLRGNRLRGGMVTEDV